MATPAEWFAGGRPRTLTAAIAPVTVGSGVAAYYDSFRALMALGALALAAALQVGVNYANDYSDGVKGTDNARVGPVRLVGQNLASAAGVRNAAIAAFAIAAAIGALLVAASGIWWLLIVGAASIAAGWLYTGGPRPYGYAGLGELFVFIFFGLIATAGTALLQTGQLTSLSLAAAVPVGLWSCTILMMNNLRDIGGDADVGKVTLAVRLGDAKSRTLYVATLGLGFVVVAAIAATWTWWALLALAACLVAVRPIQSVLDDAQGPALIPVLVRTSLVLLCGGVLLGVGIAMG